MSVHLTCSLFSHQQALPNFKHRRFSGDKCNYQFLRDGFCAHKTIFQDNLMQFVADFAVQLWIVH